MGLSKVLDLPPQEFWLNIQGFYVNLLLFDLASGKLGGGKVNNLPFMCCYSACGRTKTAKMS